MMRHASINNESPFATTYAQAGKKWVYEEKGKGKRIQARRTATQNVACLHLTRLSTYPPAKPPSAARRPVGRKKRERGKRACLQHRDGERRREKESLKHLNMATGRRGASSSPIALSAQSVKLCHTQVLLRKEGKRRKKKKTHIGIWGVFVRLRSPGLPRASVAQSGSDRGTEDLLLRSRKKV